MRLRRTGEPSQVTIAMRVLVLNADHWMGLKIVRCLHLGGVRHITALSKRCRLGARSRHVRRRALRPDAAVHEVLDQIIDVYWRDGIDVILPAIDDTYELVRRLSLRDHRVCCAPIPSVESYQLASDKRMLAEYAATHEIRVPRFAPLEWSHSTAIDAAAARVGFPALLKPAVGSQGGEWIMRVDNMADLRARCATLRAAETRPPYLLQQYVPGTDLSLSVLCAEGRIVAHAIQRNVGHRQGDFGSQRIMDFVEDEQVLTVEQELMRALKWNGVANIDFRRAARDGTLYLLEANPRFWQAIIGCAYAGVNFPLLLCQLALGRPLTAVRYRHIRYAHPGAYWDTVVRRLMGRSVAAQVSFAASGCLEILRDPLPEHLWYGRGLFDAARRRVFGARNGRHPAIAGVSAS